MGGRTWRGKQVRQPQRGCWLPWPALLGIVVAVGSLAAGCGSSHVNMARENFYHGQPQRALKNLATLPEAGPDRALFLMERGMVHQQVGDYRESVNDWMAAVAIAEALDYYSLTRGAGSLLVNDQLLAYIGKPYERVLLRAFAAKSYLAMSDWDDAAVEARNIADMLASLGGFPDDAYSHYMAGLCLQLEREHDRARIEFERCAQLLPQYGIDPQTGRFGTGNATARPPHELVCFILVGRGPWEQGAAAANYRWGAGPTSHVMIDGAEAGQALTFGDTQALQKATDERLAARTTAKTLVRVAAKEAAVIVVADKSPQLAQLLQALVVVSEAAGPKRWETLPRWLQVARIPCKTPPREVVVRVCGHQDRELYRAAPTAPLARRGNMTVTFVRVF